MTFKINISASDEAQYLDVRMENIRFFRTEYYVMPLKEVSISLR